MPENILQRIPLNEIVQDWRVQEYIRKQAREMTRKNIDTYMDRFNQVQSCHVWLLSLHYTAINRLQEKYDISKPQFMTLLSAYLLKVRGMNGFKAKEIGLILLPWQYNRVYKHLMNLSKNGYIRIERGPYSNSHRYWLSGEGEVVIRAFNQHFWRVFDEVREELGEFPNSFTHVTNV